MLTPLRAVRRLALATFVASAGLSTLAGHARAAGAPEDALPNSTVLFIKVENVAALREAFGTTAFGQLVADPAMKPFKDSIKEKLADTSKQLKSKIGVTLDELLSLPQGPVIIAVQGKGEGKFPVAILVSADAGKNEAKMTEVMNKLTETATKDGKVKPTTESFKGLTLHVFKGEKDDEPSLIWTNSGRFFHVSISMDTAALKDLISHADGRDDSLAKNESFGKVVKKVGGQGQVFWFLDVSQVIKLTLKAAAANEGGQNPSAILQILGINGLKAIGGTLSLNTGKYDSMSKTYILAPGPAQGLMKMFSMPKKDLKPEAWIPGNVSTYQTVSWDLDAAFNAVNDLVNMFQPGMINVLEQQLVGPNGGEPLSFQKDVFGPLGNRITMISDFKKPITEDSQRILIAVALEDAKKFQNTVNKLIALANGQPTKRDFQGTTIYDFKVPEIPGAAANNPIKGVVSVAIAKDYVMVATEPGLLEAVLRGGSATLADNPAFQAVIKDLPSTTSMLSYAKPEEQARASYDMIKSGKFEKALQQANPGGPDLSGLSKIFDKDKLPEFSVFAKYLSDAAGYGEMDDDGFVFTSFSVRKAKP